MKNAETVKCLECGSPFKSNSPHDNWCTVECYSKWYENEKSEWFDDEEA